MPRYPATIAHAIEHELEVKKSRFLVRVCPVADVAAAEAEIAARRKAYWDARHHCTAMVTGLLGDQARSSDDGEPSGTAGIPMLEVLRRRELTDLVAIVTRYFGGVKLGAGGLVRAYSTAVSETLDLAGLVRRETRQQVIVEAGHADAGRLDNQLRDWAHTHDAVVDAPEYGARATFSIWAAPGDAQALHAEVSSWTSGAVNARNGAERVVDLRG